ncbi:Ras-GEF domain-containing family member 1B [Orchesella cincta]|uniref:Ras-GEF domain-containing family member 1B n=1 Tax=Orchesella cincta TaxID=48709 RepID=A0A1D2MME7_ORCCI|nr:Ras-GEF domain-containing family member 1B [Orchesella cincta]
MRLKAPTDAYWDNIDLPLNVIPLLVKFLRPWTELFPYDFRDDRMMAHVRILAHKCVATDEEVREQVSQLLAALLSRLAALEKYEEFLHRVTTETSIGEPIAAPSVVTICPDPATMAETLTLIELQRFSFIGKEEFVQTLGKEDLKTGVRHCDCVNRKTKNLEAYVRWFQRLTYYVASEICKMSKKKSRCRVCEYWIQVAKECLNIRNFNSLLAILAGLNILPVARLKKTVREIMIDVINFKSCRIDSDNAEAVNVKTTF